MIKDKNINTACEINNIAACDFDLMKPVFNEDILRIGRDGKSDPRLLSFFNNRMGIKRRFHCPPEKNAMDLANSALKNLIAREPSIVDEAEFLIVAGISNPMPSVCTSALLASDFGFSNASCWDLKSGCSTGILGMLQALDWFNRGCRKGVLICAETLSKFANPKALQMSVATGDGAVAMSLVASEDWQVLGTIHGTDARLFKSIYVPGTYPVDIDNYDPGDYVFKFEEKGNTLEAMAHHWQNSLQELLSLSGIEGSDVNHYIAHQVDGSKNRAFALNNRIPEDSIALNFEDYGNMGCPTVFLNYLQWTKNRQFKKGDHLIFHAVGGGVSWAGISLRKIK